MCGNCGCSEEIDPEYERWLEERERECGASYVTGGSDPSGTYCEKPKGHVGPHEGSDPFDGSGTVQWTGGGMVAGDPLPVRDVKFLPGPREG